MAQVFPFSFKEFVSYFECKDLQQAFDRFVMQKYKIKNIPLLDTLNDFLADNISSEVSAREVLSG